MNRKFFVTASAVVLAVVGVVATRANSSKYASATAFFKTALGGCKGQITAVNGSFLTAGSFKATINTQSANTATPLYTASTCLNRAYFQHN